MNLKGKVSIVTGAGRGIGKAIAIALAREGSNLVLAARTKSQVESTAGEVQRLGVKAIPLTADVSVERDVECVVQKTTQIFGRIDILINNAGILPATIRVPVSEVSTDDWERVLEINLKGLFLFARAVLPVMKRQDEGYLIAMSSLMGRWGFTNLCLPYTASKFGICGVVEALFKEIKDTRIRVSAVCPGVVDTDFQSPARRREVKPEEWLKPEDVAEAVLFLLTRPPEVIIPELLIYPRAQFPQGRYA